MHQRSLFLRIGLAFLFGAIFLFSPATSVAGNGNSSAGGNPHVFRVVDRNGKLLGFSLSENLVAREVGDVWVSFYVQSASGIFDSRAIYLYFLTTDCTGTRYLPHYSTFSEGTRVGNLLYYPAEAAELVPQSLRIVGADGQEGSCTPSANVPGSYGAARTIEIDTFGVRPPFRSVQ